MSELNRIIQDLKFCDSMFDYILTPDDCGLLLGYIQELQQENQQLKEDIKDLDNQKAVMFKNMQLNQLKVCELAKVLNEIREYIDNTVYYTSDMKYFKDSVIGEDLLQILDKVDV